MARGDPRSTVLNNEHRSTDSSAIACDENGTVMIVDIYADELAKSSRATEPSEVCDKSLRPACQTDDASVDVHNIGVGAVYFCACCESDVCRIVRTRCKYLRRRLYLRRQA